MTTPQAVSALLRRSGFTPTPNHSKHYGVHVSRSYGGVLVTVDWPGERENVVQRENIAELLTAAGYEVEVNPLDANLLHVSKL